MPQNTIKARKPKPETGPQLTKLQKFEVQRVLRSQIKTVDYNPRKISEEARKRLHGNLQKVGLLDTLVVNRTTMNLVSGHQRIAKIDKTEGYPGKDYLIDVAMVTLTEQEEKEQNIFFNSKSAQGEYDYDMLAQLLPDIDAAASGLSEMDLVLLDLDTSQSEPITTDELSDLFYKKPKQSTDADWNDEDQIGKDKRANEVRSAKAEIKENASAKAGDKLLSYVTLNFPDMAAKTAFMNRFGLDPYLTFIEGEEFGDMCEAINETPF